MKNVLARIGVEVVRFLYLSVFWWVRGWKIEPPLADLPRMVIAAAPHTTNMDYAHFLAAAITYRRRPLVTVKQELTRGPVGWFVRALGGIAIDRSRRTNAVEQLASYFEGQERRVVVFTPDGTRSYRPHWKTGFYWAAVRAEVPIVLGYIDYPRKRIGFSDPIYPTGDIQADFQQVIDFYSTRGVGLYPDQATTVALPPQADADTAEPQPTQAVTPEQG